MEMQTGTLIVAGMFVLVLAPAFWNLLQRKRRHAKITDGTVNHDHAFREFWYDSQKPVDEILAILSESGTCEEHTYRFDRETMVLSLSDNFKGDTTRYIVLLSPRADGTRIQLYRKEGLHRTSRAGLELISYENIFCKEILGAEPIPCENKR